MMGFTEGVLTLQTYQSISLMCGNQHAQVSCKFIRCDENKALVKKLTSKAAVATSQFDRY